MTSWYLRYLPLLFAGTSAYSMSTLFSALKPVLLTRFVEQAGVTESSAGLIVAMPFVGIAISPILSGLIVDRMNLFRLAVIFGPILVAVELCSAYFYQIVPLLLLAQFVAGLSVGSLMGATSRLIATSTKPDRIFGFVDMMAVFLMSFMVAGVGITVGYLGLKGGYLFAASLGAVFSCFMIYFGRNISNEVIVSRNRARFARMPVITRRSVAVVLMGVLFVSSSGLGFAFMFTLALNLGMEYASAGQFIGILLFVSALACHVGGWTSARFGPIRPLAIAFVLCAVGWLLAINATNQLMFMAGLVPAIFSLQFCFPILLALSGSLDEEGRWASIAAPIQTSGFAWAAMMAGMIVSYWDLQALGTATAIGMSCCLLLLIYSRQPVKSH